MKRKFIITKSYSKIKSEDEFRDYAHTVMKEAHGDEYSKETTDKVVDDLLSNNPNADYGELIGRLTSGFGDKSFSSDSKVMIQLKESLKKRVEYYNTLKKSLSNSNSEFDKARLELANNNVLEAQLYVKRQEIKDKYDNELAKVDEQINKLALNWQELYDKVSNANT